MNNYILALDGQAVILHNPVVTLDQDLAEKDQSGQSSSTTASEQGQKAKTLSVKGVIRFADVNNLTKLFDLANARDPSGARHLYRIANSTAQAVKMRQAVFSGKINVSQDEKLLAWNISFTLTERLSVQEKRETIENTSSPAIIDDDEKTQEKHSYIEEKILKPMDNALS